MSKNMYTNRNTHDTNCHRNYGGPNKDAVTTGTFEQADRTDDFDYDYLGKSASANDQTGLIHPDHKMMTKLNLIRMCFLLRHRC